MHRQPGSLLDRRGFGQGAGTPASGWRCPACGKGNIASARFCGGCGRLTSLAATIPSTGSGKMPAAEVRANSRPGATPPSSVFPSSVASTPVVERTGSLRTASYGAPAEETIPNALKIQTFAPAEPSRRRPIREEPLPPVAAAVDSRFAPAIAADDDTGEGYGESPDFQKPDRRNPLPEKGPVGSALQNRFRQWFGPRLGLFMLVGCVVGGLSLSILILSGFGLRGERPEPAVSRELLKVVPWADLRVWLGARLGLSPDEVDRLAVRSLGAIPVADRLMTRAQIRRVGSWINGRIGEAGMTLPEVAGDGYLLMADLIGKGKVGTSPFNDVPLDHPLYAAWKPLLDLELANVIADDDGRARPYDSLQWEEWSEVCRRIEQRFSAGAKARPNGARMVGEMSPAALASALDDMARFPAFEHLAGRNSESWKPASNSRMEAFAALASLIGGAEEAETVAAR